MLVHSVSSIHRFYLYESTLFLNNQLFRLETVEHRRKHNSFLSDPEVWIKEKPVSDPTDNF